MWHQPQGVEATITTMESLPLLKEAYFEALDSETNAETVLTLDISIPAASHHAFSIPLRRSFTHDPEGIPKEPAPEWNLSVHSDGVSPTGKGIGESIHLRVESSPDDPGIQIHIECSWSESDGANRSLKEVLPVLVGSSGKWQFTNGATVTTGFRKPQK